MQRIPKGQYFRDSWDWLQEDALFAHDAADLPNNTTAGLILMNQAVAGEFLDMAWIYVTISQPCIIRLIADPAPDTSGGQQNPQVSYLSTIEGQPAAQLLPYNLQGTGAIILHQTGGTFTEWWFPRVDLRPFVRIPATWGLGVRVGPTPAACNLQVTWYGQYIAESSASSAAIGPVTLRR